MRKYPDNEIYDIRRQYREGDLGYDAAMSLLMTQHGFDEVQADRWLFE